MPSTLLFCLRPAGEMSWRAFWRLVVRGTILAVIGVAFMSGAIAGPLRVRTA